MTKKKIAIYQIETTVAPPDAAVPLTLMSVGDSVLFPIEKRNSVQSAVSRMKGYGSPKRFTVRREGELYCRIWRTK